MYVIFNIFYKFKIFYCHLFVEHKTSTLFCCQDFTSNGLFTSSEKSEDWKTGHNLLPRGFNQIKVKSFAPQILAKTRAFVAEWSKFEAGQKVEDVNEWLTAMTADAVVSCSMGMDMCNVERLGSKQPPHKFVETFRFGLGVSMGSITSKSEYGLKRFLPFFDAEGQLQERFNETKKDRRFNDIMTWIV